tara:strand:+ start:89 stop:274 length:186 start_codon:yes stop_codon:yes gene_type:complete
MNMENQIIEWLAKDRNLSRWNGFSDSIGWYACVPMTLLASSLGMSLFELEEAIRNNTKKEE